MYYESVTVLKADSMYKKKDGNPERRNMLHYECLTCLSCLIS